MAIAETVATDRIGTEGLDWSAWPRYEAAALGFRNYWYPVMWSRRLGATPVPVTLLGEKIVLVRDRGKVYALQDRCAHRGIPLSCKASPTGRRTFSKQIFPGTITCGFHGWTYDLASGVVVAALTDGPDSPIRGKARARTYPVEERLGLVWLFIGDADPPQPKADAPVAPPVEADIPEELMREQNVWGGRITDRAGNWRLAAEGGLDEGHARSLHRNTPFMFFRQFPCWTKTHVIHSEDGKWVSHVRDEVHFEGDFPGLGKWPAQKWWAKKRSGLSGGVSIRLPGLLRVKMHGFVHYEWYVPIDADHHRYIQIAVKFTGGLDALWFELRYWAYIRWLFHGWFNNQDAVMLRLMDAPPERLYRPDLSIIAWRKLCERARQ